MGIFISNSGISDDTSGIISQYQAFVSFQSDISGDNTI